MRYIYNLASNKVATKFWTLALEIKCFQINERAYKNIKATWLLKQITNKDYNSLCRRNDHLTIVSLLNRYSDKNRGIFLI